MLDVFHISKPQGCDIQTFYGDGAVSTVVKQSWVKPRGVSHVYILMIGAGGNGSGSVGGGSGAVTVWYGAAQNVPDILFPIPGRGQGQDTRLGYKGSGATIIALLTAASGGTVGSAGAAMTANQFAASGFFQSIAGQAGNSGPISASATTFLSGGGITSITGNYGYASTTTIFDGFFQMQPIIVGLGGTFQQKGGIGCGGGDSVGLGGPGMVLIASW